MMKNKQDLLSDFPMPTSTEMELQVIADLITAPEEMQDARGIIKPEMFSDEQCRHAWNTLCDMEERHQTIDLTTIYEREDKGFLTNRILPKLSTSGYLGTRTHLVMLAGLSVRKRAWAFAVRMLQDAASNTASLDELLSMPEDFANEVRADLGANSDSVAVSEVMNEVAEGIEQIQRDRDKGRPTRVPTGFPSLNTMTYGGFNAGNLVIVAARPSVGKTAVMLKMARAAANAGIPATIFSLEMTNSELGQRLLLSTGIVKPLQLTRGEVEWADFETAAGKFCITPLFLNDAVRTIDEIVSRIILNHQQRRCGIAFIDYLGLIDTRTEGRMQLYQIIAQITRRLKLTAKDCRIPIVLLCQLNRNSESENRPPQMRDLRDSGSIEQDADIVLMLERPGTMGDAYTNEDARLNMWVRKNRQGKAGDIYIELQPDSTYTNFAELGVRG